MKRNLSYIFGLFAVMVLLVACSKEDDGATVSKDPIIFDVQSEGANSATRGVLFDKDESLYSEELGGGNFTAHAYVDQTSTRYLDSRVWYMKDADRWWLRNGNDWYDAYWPKNNKLSFFAYMPWESNKANVTVGSGYTYKDATDADSDLSGGPEFSCNLPLDNTSGGINQENVYEFAYAYTKDQDKANNPVELNFVHPMSAVTFDLKQSHRDLTIHTLGFKNIYNEGTYSYCEETTNANLEVFKDGFTYNLWEPIGSANKTLNIRVEKTIPEDINFDAEVGGPFIVMPQSLANVKFHISYTWDGATHDREVALNTGPHEAWQPGYKYTYVLDLGDNQEEILFRVLIDPWIPVDHKNEIDID